MFSEFADPGALVFATVGTDHHPFDRLVLWLDEWLASRARDRRDCLVQIGTSLAPRLARSRRFLSYPEMESALAQATAVVCHAGPGTVMMALAAGKKPIVVPRDSALGEHVDDHQLVFARRVFEEGSIWLANGREHLAELLDRAIACPDEFRCGERRLDGETSVQRLAVLVDRLVAARELTHR